MSNERFELLQYHDLIASIVTAMEARDAYTADHSMRVAEMTEALCECLHLSEEETALYHISAHLHDLGKIGIADAILRKEGSLSDSEWNEMKKHPVIGYDILHKIVSFRMISDIVRAHHERWDGTGYPDRLKGEQIPFGARIIAVADSMDAMLSARPYRKGMAEEKCQEEIRKNTGRMYDAVVSEAALSHWKMLMHRRNTACSFGQARKEG